MSAPTEDKNVERPRDLRFWAILSSLCLSLFLSALEFTAVSTALPTITADLHGDSFIWVGAAYALTSSAILPMTGGIAQIFGRRPAMIISILLFMLGSAICGAAQNMAMLIAGRAVQGMGGGGILSFSSIILADIVALKDRGVYAGVFGLTWSLAAAIGPVIGGSLTNQGQWRWIFYLNIPIGAVAGLFVVILLNLPTPPGTLRSKLSRLDWLGNFIIIGSTAATTIALTDGGVTDPWPSAKILAPLIIGLVGLCIFLAYEAILAGHPLVPFSILANRTSASGYAQTFLLPVTSLAVIYYLPVYFQACKGADPNRSGVLLLSMASVAVGAVVGGRSIRFVRRYRPQIWFGWVLQTIGVALLTLIKLNTHVGVAVGFVIIYGTGAGVNYALQVYPVQAPLPVSANAHALAFLAFMRSFAGVWGVTLGGAILQNELQRRLPPVFLSRFPSGASIVYAAIPDIASLQEPLRTQVREAFVDSLRVIWKVVAAVSGLGLLSSLFMGAYGLHAVTDKKWMPTSQSKEKKGAGEENGDGDVQLVAVQRGEGLGQVLEEGLLPPDSQ